MYVLNLLYMCHQNAKGGVFLPALLSPRAVSEPAAAVVAAGAVVLAKLATSDIRVNKHREVDFF